MSKKPNKNHIADASKMVPAKVRIPKKPKGLSDMAEYCVGCKKWHEMPDGFFWSKGKKFVEGYFCKDWMECVGCRELHKKDHYMKLRDEGWYCSKWFKPSAPSLERRMEGMSPEEVLSGVQYGYDRDPSLGADSKKGWEQEHREQVKEFKKALDDL